ncbi:MAG: alpha/beta hydrolase [Anaerolineae bacterium]
MGVRDLVLKAFCVGAAAAGLAAAVVSAIAAGSVWRMTRRRPPDPPEDPAVLGLAFEEVAFRARDGLLLRGWFLPAPGVPADGPAVIFCHGHSGSMDPDLRYVPALHEAGCHVLMFDFRGHGRSEGQRVGMGYLERWDLLGAVDFLWERGIRRIGVLGFSMGGAAALLTAAECPRILAVATDGAFARLLPVLVAGMRQRGLPGPVAQAAGRLSLALMGWELRVPIRDVSPLDCVPALAPRPLLLIHGGRDAFVPLEEALALYARAGFPKTLWLVGEAGHREVDQARPEAYRARLGQFFRQALGAGPVPAPTPRGSNPTP